MTATGIGRVLLFGVVLTPVYVMLVAWFVGRPRELRLPLIGVGLLIGFTTLAWGGLAAFAWLLGRAFSP